MFPHSNNRLQRSNKSGGFTLIEILIAMAITALIGVGALSLLDTATRSGGQLKKDGNRLSEIQRAFLFISNDLQQLTTRQIRNEYGDPVPSMKSDLQASTPFVSITRLGRRNPANLARSNLEHLIYRVEDKQLIRTSYLYADGMPENMGQERPVLEKVESMSIEFYDGESWHDYWPLEDAFASDGKIENRLPVGVRFKLELSDYGEIVRLYAISDLPKGEDDRQ